MRSAKRGRKKKRSNFQYNRSAINRKNNALKKKKKSDCVQIEQAWEHKKTTKDNLQEMGLAYDVNQVMKIPSIKDQLANPGLSMMEIDSSGKSLKKRRSKKAQKVISALEEESGKERSKDSHLNNTDLLFVVKMIERHGDDYQAMARDRANVYQESAGRIKRLCNIFKKNKTQYSAYLKAKSDDVEMVE